MELSATQLASREPSHVPETTTVSIRQRRIHASLRVGWNMSQAKRIRCTCTHALERAPEAIESPSMFRIQPERSLPREVNRKLHACM